MISLSVDAVSREFAGGYVLGVLAVAVVALGLLWWLTSSWRAPATPAGSDPAVTIKLERSRRNLVLAGTAVIVVVGSTVGLVGSRSGSGTSQASARSAPTDIDGRPVQPSLVTAPEAFGDYRLLTGAAAEQADATVRRDRKGPTNTKFWYYGKGDEDGLQAVLIARSTAWDPALTAERENQSAYEELGDFFAGAKAHGTKAFSSGSPGGDLSCGFVTGPVDDLALCAWSDRTSFGSFRIETPTTLEDAAQATTALRTAATGH
ncbi:hypothetical protein ACIRP0_35505 [Streptomyces sp. NPDC101733]|uniref:hypothetical protein n=1 Tax=unclassified Streptomyces TaxID=2593676 RepID=UPI0038203604